MIGKHETEKLQYNILKNRLREKEKKQRKHPREQRKAGLFLKELGTN